MTQNALKWFIFAMLVATVPVIFYLFMWIGETIVWIRFAEIPPSRCNAASLLIG